MVQYCVVPGCKNSALIPGIRFHCFPKNPTLKKIWEIKIRRGSQLKPISSTMRVCSKHFTEADYDETPKKDKWYLKKNAVPSVFPFEVPKRKPRRKLPKETNNNVPQENASVAIQEKTDSNPVIVKVCSVACSHVSRAVSEEHTSVANTEENDPFLLNEIPCIEDYLEVSMAVAEENLNVANLDENNLNPSTTEEQQVKEKCLEVRMAVSNENAIVGLDTKVLVERVKKLEGELAALKSENSTLRSIVTELTTELLKYKFGREYT